MSENEEVNQRAQSLICAPLGSNVSYDHLHASQLNKAQFRAQIQPFLSNFNGESGSKRVGMPPVHPQVPSSQPLFFSVDSLPPLNPSSYRGISSALAYDQVVGDASLPRRKTHRRSNSDIPFGFSTILQSSPPLIPSNRSQVGRNNIKQESSLEKTGGEVVDDWFSSYVNVNNLGKLNSFRTENREDLDSSDNEATSSVIGSSNNMQQQQQQQMSGVCSVSDKREGVKRRAGGDIAPTRHYRSLSMDSVMEKMNFVDDSLKMLHSPGGQIGKLLSSGSIEAHSDTFCLEFGNGVFNGAELKKIMANENLAEMALTDPKRVKRILANRQSAARSKERKMRYIAELETKVQTLQTETTTLSAQVTSLQRDLTSLTSQNSELKFRVQAMEQQAHLRDALNDTLTAEVQRLKMVKKELNADAASFSQLSINPQMFQLQQEQNGGATTHE